MSSLDQKVRVVLEEGEVERVLRAREGVVAASGDPAKHASAVVAGSVNAISSIPSPSWSLSRMAHTLLGMRLFLRFDTTFNL